MTPNRTRWLLATLALSGAAQAASTTTGARLSLIDIMTTYNKSLMRVPYFVEIQDIEQDKVLKEYSVPYSTEFQVRAFAQDARDNWKIYQDNMHWAMQVALNNDAFTNLMTSPPPIGNAVVPAVPVDTYYQNCQIQLTADLWTSITKSIAGVTDINTAPAIVLPSVGVGNTATDQSNARGKLAKKLDLAVSDPMNGSWKNDGTGLEFVLAPRVTRSNYCPMTSANYFPPDYTAPYMPGNVYEMSIKWVVGPFAGTIGPAVTTVINWSPLYQRLNTAGTQATKKYYTDYQKNTALSLAKNLPTAIHWDGAFLPSGGTKSGATIAPFYAFPVVPQPGQTLLSDHDKDVLDAAKKNPQFPLYLGGMGLPIVNNIMAAAAPNKDVHSVGDKNMEELKRTIRAGTFQQQQKEGMATFLHTWQQMDMLVDARPLIYWTPNQTCINFVCTSIATPNPISSVNVTPVTATAIPTNTIGSGTTIFETFRYRWGVQTTPEGHILPGTTNHPVMRVDNE